MRTIAMYLVLAATASAGCLRSTEFRCTTSSDCGNAGTCEANGFCSVSNPSCAGTERSYGDSAGQGLANTCVPGGNPGIDAGIDAPMTDGPMGVKCPAPFAAVGSSAHLYKRLPNISADNAKNACKVTTAVSYLAIPDDPTELMTLASVAMGTPFWIGINYVGAPTNEFVTQKGVTATFLPWQPNPPDTSGGKTCVDAISATQITTEKCNVLQVAVCECEP